MVGRCILIVAMDDLVWARRAGQDRLVLELNVMPPCTASVPPSCALQGARLVHGRTSYTAQTAWIRNASVRDNILMGRAYDAALYAAVISACALQSDFDLLAAGEQL